MKILSLFDGISCGYLALQRAGIPIEKYYASEIDKDAIKVSKYHFPDIIRLGDIRNIPLVDVDLVMGGSSCKGFSAVNQEKENFEHKESSLFFDFVAILEDINPKYFLLENVKMKSEWLDIMTSYMGVEPILIDSALVSPQSRERYYWTNIDFEIPDDHGISFRETFKANPAYIKTFEYGEPTLLTREYDKGHTLTTNWKSMILSYTDEKALPAYQNKSLWRTGTVEERCVMQTLPKDFLNLPGNDFNEEYSLSSLYQMVGNCWTVDIIKYILKGLK